jgi:hypothetical protein
MGDGLFDDEVSGEYVSQFWVTEHPLKKEFPQYIVRESRTKKAVSTKRHKKRNHYSPVKNYTK